QQVARTTFVMKLTVNRDAFGPRRWLKLNPLGIVLDGRLELGKIPLGVEVVGVKIAADGLHWPLEMAAAVRRTAPAGPLARSDPWRRVILPQDAANRLMQGEYRALGDLTYLLGGKLTPPSLRWHRFHRGTNSAG